MLSSGRLTSGKALTRERPMHRTAVLLTALAVLVAVPELANAKKGLYFGFSLGGAIVNGDRAITMSNPKLDPDFAPICAGGQCPPTDKSILFSTDEGGGFAANFRFGYNILGFVAIELDFGGSGNGLSDSDKLEGQVGIYGLVRMFPAQLFKGVEDRWWDPYLFVGGGVYMMAYHPDAHQPADMINDGRVWFPSSAVKYGFGCDFYVARFFSLGVDLAFINAFHGEFKIDNEDDISTSARDGATSFAFQPTAKLTFHFLTD